MIRLQKVLSDAGICSRRKAEEFIKKGLVKVNNEVVTEMGVKIDPSKDKVKFKGEFIKTSEKKYYILNKPKGYTCTLSRFDKRSILSLIKVKERLYHVGRLDKDSSGLLILTNDGELANRLTHPKYEHEKEYVVETERTIPDKHLRRLATGIILEGKRTAPAKVKKISKTKFHIIIHEGRNKQIRRMVSHIGGNVKELKRIRIGKLKLDDLKEGECRKIDSHLIL